MARIWKETTRLTGLAVARNPHTTLRALYEKTLRLLVQIPQDAAYRKHTEPIIRERLQLVNSIKDPEKLEKTIDSGQIEEVIIQAEREMNLAEVFIEYRPWEPLVEEAPAKQWKWPL